MPVLLKLLLLFHLLAPTQENWQRINTPNGLSFLFPNHPQKLSREVDQIPATIYQTKNAACVFGVVCSDFSGKEMLFTAENFGPVYEEMKKGSLDVGRTLLKKEYTVPSEEYIIKEIEYTILKDNHEMTYFKRFIFNKNMIYQITIGGRNRHLDIIQKEKEIFFNSIHFITP